jgi:hypothetical protein
MATLLTKDVERETFAVTNRRGEKVIVKMKAGDMLEFRVKGKRTRFEVPLASCFYLSMIQYMEDQYKKKMKRYKERKALGLRTKRPKRPPQVFSKKWYEALKMK